MKEKFYKTEIRLKGKDLVILTPVKELKELFACTNNLNYLTIFGDIKNFMRLACIFAIMYKEKQVIMYLPLKQHGLTEYLKVHQGENSNKDIVILHHTTQFNTKHWKKIRRLRVNRHIITFEINNNTFSTIDEDYRIFHYKSNKDVLDLRNTFDTIFLVGSSKVYGGIANDCREFSEGKPDEFFKKYKWNHEHRHLDMYLRKWRQIDFSIDYYDKQLWGS